MYGIGEDWGAAWTLSGGNPEMISDSHIGFDKPRNTDPCFPIPDS
jgi:hypothetical protein